MSGNRMRIATSVLMVPLFFLTSCGRAPAFDVLGSFFPAWLICLAIALLLTVVARWVLVRVGIELAMPVLTYPSLVALFTFALWLAFFH